MVVLAVDRHPLLDLRAFVAEFSRPLEQQPSEEALLQGLSSEKAGPMQSNDEVRLAVRDLLRHGGFKPTGRSKPASEYLIKAADEGWLSTINVAVDVCNVVSLHSGLPISVIDLDRAKGPYRVAIAPAETEYVFNPSGQTIRLDGLICLFDAEGPCANPVKDSQRTKTGPETRRTMTLIWGTTKLPGRASQAERWYRQLLESHGAVVHSVNIQEA